MTSSSEGMIQRIEGEVQRIADSEGINPFDPRRPIDDSISFLKTLPTGGTLSAPDLIGVASALREDRGSVMESDRFCVSSPATGAKARGVRFTLGVQHCASGLLVLIRLDRDDPTFVARVESRPYEYGLICQDHGATENHWRSYRALGIGQRLYRHADDSLLGDRRWPRSILHPGSKHLRDRLHSENPFKWETDECSTCASAGITDWKAAGQDQFPPHR